MVRLRFTLANTNDVVSRISKLVEGITIGVGARELKNDVENTVVNEYAKAFASGGFPGNRWRSSKGPVSFIRDKKFIKSFSGKGSGGLEVKVNAGKTYLLIRVASGHVNPRMDLEYVAALRRGIELSDEHSIEQNISGSAGGISRAGARGLFGRFRQIVIKEAKRVGYT